jgi:hypothetical protein
MLMRGFAGRFGMLVLFLAWIGLMAWFAIRVLDPSLAPARVGSAADAGDVGDALSRAREYLWHAIRVPLMVALLLGGALLAIRWRARRRRRYARLWLLPHRADEALSEDVRSLLESWHQLLLERWWRRIPFGQSSISLELMVSKDADGDRSVRLAIVCPVELVDGIEGSLLACYPDSRVVRGRQGLPRVNTVVRLKKRHHYLRALRSSENRGSEFVDAVLSQMATMSENVVLQFALVPTPARFESHTRRRFTAEERASEAAHERNRANPGLRSEVLSRELEGALRVQHHPLFFTELRVAAETYRGCKAIAGVVRGTSGAENRLVERYMRPQGRGPLYLWRLRAAVGNPIPGWRRGVFSSDEVAAMWRLPSPGLKLVRLTRSAVPRMPAPPDVSRVPSHALARDEHGLVGILPEDKSDGLGLIGGQKTGKTSLLCRTVRADALDPDCAMVVLMPKPGDATKSLSMIPRERTVHYLDLERPEFGLNPLLAPGDAGSIADRVVDAFRDVNAEGDIKGSSDRFLRQAAQAAIGASRAGALGEPPNLWHMYRILIPVERAFRERVVEAIAVDPRLADTASFFGRELPGDLDASPGQTAAKLDAPRNKLLRLLVESLDRVLRHPRQLDLDEIVRNREVLIVDGKMGTFGSDNCRVMMQFILSSLFGTLQRQQQLPEAERVRVAVKVDEAHLILNESFADALATLRSAGLEVVAAWQYGEQIQDPKVRAGMMSLLRQRCMFSMGEEADAREMSTIAMTAYTDMIRTDPESRSRLRVTPDTIFNLPNHHAICSWISRGARMPAFVAQTIPLETDDDVVLHHLQAQRARGGFVPDTLPDPMPDVDFERLPELPSGELNGSREEAAPEPVDDAAPVALDFDPDATSVDDSANRPVKAAGPPPETWTELDLDSVRGVVWDKVAALPPDRRPEPSGRELEILAALWSHRFLFASQIHRRWWRGSSLRAAQQGLGRMAKAGWVRRFRLQLGERGAQQGVYCITRLGFELAQANAGRRGPYTDKDATWREPVISDGRRVARSLHINGWALAFEARAGKTLRGWRGPREGRLNPPRRKVRGEWIAVEPREITVGSSYKLRDFEPSAFEPVTPDTTLELELPMGEGKLRFDLLVEWAGARLEDRLRGYDGLLSGWSGMLERYKTLGTPPLVLFVCEDEPSLNRLVKLADRVVTARLAKPGAVETDWPHPGRRGMFFALERDIHMGSLEALALPERAPDLRVRLDGRKAAACRPRRVTFIEPRLIDSA